jgi:hypothetical protein
MILLSLVYHKLLLLSKKRAACYLYYLLIALLLAWMVIMAPVLFWHDYLKSIYRVFAGCVFISIFIASTAIATLAMCSAAKDAKTIARKSGEVSADVLQAIRWLRWTAYATFSSMSSSILMHATLSGWRYNSYPRNTWRIAVDWMEGFDFILNTLCAASLSGMIGSQSSLDFVEEGLEQIGTLLEKHTETSVQAETAIAVEIPALQD